MPQVNRLKISTPALVIVGIVVAGVVAHSINAFRYPFYDTDEGTYMYQAWAVSTLGKLTPYTYDYDHAPLGWMLIALWAKITGGFHTFGFTVNSGRVLMLVLQALNGMLLVGISRSLYKGKYSGVLALILFMLSPLSILHHRRVFLDNILTFWVLLSMFTLLRSKLTASKIGLSGALLGLGILSKETGLAFIPAFIVTIIYISGVRYKNIRSTIAHLVLWIMFLTAVLSAYPLYALSQNQLFENDSGIWLIKTFGEQLERGTGSMLDLENGFFWRAFREWIATDPVLLLLGLVATLINLVLGLRYRYPAVAGLFSVAILAYLGRGGLVFPFYIIPFLPFLALNIEAFIYHLPNRIVYPVAAVVLSLFLISTIYFSTHINGDENLFTFNQTQPQIEAVNYIKDNASPGSKNIIESYAYVNLNDNETLSRNFDYYWKVEFDRLINGKVYEHNYRTVEYILASPNLYADTDSIASFDVVRDAVTNSATEIRFEQDGWYVDIRRVR